jgi:hypothetical protein
MTAKRVEIIVTNIVVGSYEARSYPDDEEDADGLTPLYKVPVHKILVQGADANNNNKVFEFMAPRFMPYFNNPEQPDTDYTTKGWVNSGLTAARTVIVSEYKQNYEVRNRYSPGRGAIVLKSTFYLHAGPASLQDVGFGSAGCIEVIGNYDLFKQAIADLSGLSSESPDSAIQQLVNSQKLIVTIQAAAAPDIKSNFTRKARLS